MILPLARTRAPFLDQVTDGAMPSQASRSRPVTFRRVSVLFAAGVQERGSELGSVVADFVAVAGGGNEACVAEGKQVA